MAKSSDFICAIKAWLSYLWSLPDTLLNQLLRSQIGMIYLQCLPKTAEVQRELPHIQAAGAKHATQHGNIHGFLKPNWKRVLSQSWREIAVVLFFLSLDVDFNFLKLFHSNVWDFYESPGLWFCWYLKSFQVGSAGSELSSEVRFLVWTLTEVT